MVKKSCDQFHEPNVWYSLNGERLGSFRGHNGAVWSIDVNCILPFNLFLLKVMKCHIFA
jgi:hypothetical protein